MPFDGSGGEDAFEKLVRESKGKPYEADLKRISDRIREGSEKVRASNERVREAQKHYEEVKARPPSYYAKPAPPKKPFPVRKALAGTAAAAGVATAAYGGYKLYKHLKKKNSKTKRAEVEMDKLAKLTSDFAKRVAIGAVGGGLTGGVVGKLNHDAAGQKNKKKPQWKAIAKGTALGAAGGSMVGAASHFAGPSSRQLKAVNAYAKKKGYRPASTSTAGSTAWGAATGGLYGAAAQASDNVDRQRKKKPKRSVLGATLTGAALGGSVGHIGGRLKSQSGVDRIKSHAFSESGWKGVGFHARQRNSAYNEESKARNARWAAEDAEWAARQRRAGSSGSSRASGSSGSSGRSSSWWDDWARGRTGGSRPPPGGRAGSDHSSRHGSTSIPPWLAGAKTKAEAKAAWRAQARKLHPDVAGGSEEAFKKANNEWSSFEKFHLDKLSFVRFDSFLNEMSKIASYLDEGRS